MIRRVHEAALVLHERMEIPASPRELLPETVTTDLEQLGSSGIGDAENLTEDVDQPPLAIEAQQISFDTVPG